jgi:hypothetical protein
LLAITGDARIALLRSRQLLHQTSSWGTTEDGGREVWSVGEVVGVQTPHAQT